MNSKILIGTVLHNDFHSWLSIQLNYIKLTTGVKYEVAVVSNKQYPETTWIKKEHESHPSGLDLLCNHFKNRTNEFTDFLFLDSDCFPVRKNWYKKIKSLLLYYKKSYAAPIRYENLEAYPHVCFVFVPKEYLSNISENITRYNGKADNFAENFKIKKQDLGSHLPISTVFPLLRSNKLSIHPSMYSIYYDMIYHHGCGSRDKYMVSFPYWEDGEVNSDLIDDENFFLEPEKYIEKFCGAKPYKMQFSKKERGFWSDDSVSPNIKLM